MQYQPGDFIVPKLRSADEKGNFTIYLVRNTVNGKVYIGQTKGLLSQRWKNHCWLAKSSHRQSIFQLAIRKYGPGAFNVGPLAQTDNAKSADFLEWYFIRAYNATDRGIGYNICLGGANPSVFGRKFSEGAKRKLSEAAQRRKPISEETRQRMKESALRRGSHGPHTEEAKRKMVETIKKNRKPISEETRQKMRASAIKRGPQKILDAVAWLERHPRP
jgi:group I intron endonuclease